MNDLSIRLTRRTRLGDKTHEETVDFDFGKPLPQPIIGAITEDTLVPGDASAMQDALLQISAQLGCANSLDDIQHAIDALSPPRLEWSPTLCNGERVNYADAEKACAALGEGWRLPTRMELESILDLTRHDPAVDTTRFPDTKSGWYWSSTPCAWSSDGAWIVSFSYGSANYNHRDYNYAFVRAVRGVPAGQ